MNTIKIGMVLVINILFMLQHQTRARDEIDFESVKEITTTPAAREEEWWTTRHQEKMDERRRMAEVDLVLIGDSITHGWEGPGKKIWGERYAPRNALNLGYSDDRTEHVIWRLQNGEVDEINPRLAIVMIGTNNTGHRRDPASATAAGIQAIIQEIRKRLPETKILLLAVFPRGKTTDDKLRRINAEINILIEKFADDQTVFFLNINSNFLDENGRLPKSIMPDLLHPNENGYRIWATTMEPTVKKLFDAD